jgi:hypothetical protein
LQKCVNACLTWQLASAAGVIDDFGRGVGWGGDQRGHTAAELAFENGHAEVAALLLDREEAMRRGLDTLAKGDK